LNDWGRGDGKFLSEEEKRTQSTTSVVSLCFFLPFLVLSVRAGTSIEQQRDRYRMEPHFLLSYITCLGFRLLSTKHSLTHPTHGESVRTYLILSSLLLSITRHPPRPLLPKIPPNPFEILSFPGKDSLDSLGQAATSVSSFSFKPPWSLVARSLKRSPSSAIRSHAGSPS